MGYSQDLCDRVIDAVTLEGMSRRAAAHRFGVSECPAIRWVWRYGETGQRTATGTGGHRRSVLKPHIAFVTALRVEQPDITLEHMCRRLAEEYGVKADTSMMIRFLRRKGITHKKTLVAGGRERPDVRRRRDQWRKYQDRVDPTRLVFIDETRARTNMTRTHGWAPRGERLVAKVPHGKRKTTTFLAVLHHDRIEAPCVFDGPINGERFLPKYSPDLNPIGQVFAKLKGLLRQAAARTVDDICDVIGQALKAFSPQECETTSQTPDMRQPKSRTL